MSSIAHWRTLSGRTVYAACRRLQAEYRACVQSLGNIGVGRMWVEIRRPSGEWVQLPNPEWVDSLESAEGVIRDTEWRAANPEVARVAEAHSDAHWDRMCGTAIEGEA